MSILDDAIREHLELKRAHGADEAELKRLEDEAFGPPGRPEEPDPARRGADRVHGDARGAEAARRPTRTAAAGSTSPTCRSRRRRSRSRRRRRARARRGRRCQAADAGRGGAPAAEHEAILERARRRATRPRSATRSPSSRPNSSTSRRRWGPRTPLPDRGAEPLRRGDRRGRGRRAEAGPGRTADRDPRLPRRGPRRRPRPRRKRTRSSGATSASPTSSTRRSRRRWSEDEEPLAEAPRTEEPISEEHEQPAASAEPTQSRARAAGQLRPRHRSRGRARGHPRLPRGRPGGRRALVRAEAPEGLRLRRLAAACRLGLGTRGPEHRPAPAAQAMVCQCR